MNFGEKLRQLRSERQWTQPELAEIIGIEQSYLSKLENNRSVPSNDTFCRILEVFGIDPGEVLRDLDHRSRNDLRLLPRVADHLAREKKLLIGNRQRWLVVAATLIALGSALIYGGYNHLFFPNVVYQYESEGVVLSGEPKEIFRRAERYMPSAIRADRDRMHEYLDAIKARTDEEYRLSSVYRGKVFNVDVDGGSRTYWLSHEQETDPWQSKLIVFAGLLVGVFGLISLVIERKLSY